MAQTPLSGDLPLNSTNGQASLVATTEWTLRKIVLATLTVVGVALAFLLLYRFYSVVFLLFVAIAVQIALDPLVRFLSTRGVHKVAALLIVYLLLFALIFGIIWFGAPALADQVREVTTALPTYYENARAALLHSPVGLVRGLASAAPAQPDLSMLAALVSNAQAEGAQAAAEAGPVSAQAVQGAATGSAWHWVEVAASIFFGLFAVFAIAFYWTLEGDVIVRRLILQAPAARRDELRALVTESQSKIGAFFRGQAILCGIIGLLSTIAYLILGIPNALLLGFFMFLFESVPVAGPFLGAIPGVIVTLSAAPEKLPWVILALVVIQTAEANLLVPRVMDRSVGVNAIISLLALAAFGALFGLLGALLAIPLAAILQIVLGRVLFNVPINDEVVAAPTVTPDVSRSKLGVMRLEAQSVVQALRKQARSEDISQDLADGAEQTEDDIEAIAAELDTLLAEAEVIEEAEEAA